MSNTECKRCGGHGLEQYKRDAGKCFVCGAMPRGVASADKLVLTPADKRYRLIMQCKNMLSALDEDRADMLDWEERGVIDGIRWEANRLGAMDVYNRFMAALAKRNLIAA